MSSEGTVLHLQKVAGISGSEAHLLSLLPRLKERGWDIRFLMLHEDEPGAWDFARELTARGIPLDAIPLAQDVDPVAFLRLAAYLGRARPRILHTHLVHADVYGQLTGALTGIPVRVSTKHGFNEFRENRGFALGDRAIASLAHTHIAISRGLARYLEEVEGFDGASFEIVHYGIEPNGIPQAYSRVEPRILCVGRLIPIKGHIVLLRAFAEARRGSRRSVSTSPGRGPLEPALRALAKELGSTTPCASSATSRRCSARSRTRRSWSSRRWRRLRHGRARGDERSPPVIAARSAASASSSRRASRGCSSRRARRSRWRTRSCALRPTSTARPRWARPAAAVRSSTFSRNAVRSAPSCSTRTALRALS